MHVRELFDLTGKTAVVTGGGRGLGEQIAIGLAEAGSNVVVCSRKVENCIEISKKLEELGVESTALQCDVTNGDDIQNVIDQTVEKFGTIDILVNNSGASWGAPVDDMPLEAFQKVINVNVVGTFLMSQAVGKVMTKQGYGKIINIASVAAFRGSYPELMDAIGYNASKGGVVSFTKDLAVKWGPQGIHVNAIAPGMFPTKMSKVMFERNREKYIEGIPLRRVGTDKDLKGAALFLASQASDYVTGETIVVDGGSIAH
ncbi:SDR family oxidoreductase [Oceanobacillus salinisoli]|uniref:SDR family oxidoreductase n=1 Tax=Oceanobacillus salinisoli TaxID=2678611 RepID=UPI0012E2F519|nr:SDR family oxidoreductase [Oceanobacillus salinisoli]